MVQTNVQKSHYSKTTFETREVSFDDYNIMDVKGGSNDKSTTYTMMFNAHISCNVGIEHQRFFTK